MKMYYKLNKSKILSWMELFQIILQFLDLAHGSIGGVRPESL